MRKNEKFLSKEFQNEDQNEKFLFLFQSRSPIKTLWYKNGENTTQQKSHTRATLKTTRCLRFGKFVCLLCHQSQSFTPLTLAKDSLSRYFQTGYGEKLGLVWRNRKKISQIINDYTFAYRSFSFLFYALHAGEHVKEAG